MSTLQLPALRANPPKPQDLQVATQSRLLLLLSLPKVAGYYSSDFDTYLVCAGASSEDEYDDDYPDADEEDEDETGPDTDLDAYPSDSDEEPVPAPPTRSTRVAHVSPKPGTQTRRVPGTCLVPNCGKPSFVDRSGAKGDYCSTRHRE